MQDTAGSKLYKQMQVAKTAAVRVGPLQPNRRDPAFIRYLHFTRLWNREQSQQAAAAD